MGRFIYCREVTALLAFDAEGLVGSLARLDVCLHVLRYYKVLSNPYINSHLFRDSRARGVDQAEKKMHRGSGRVLIAGPSPRRCGMRRLGEHERGGDGRDRGE